MIVFLDDVKDYLGVDSDDHSSDALIDVLIPAAIAEVEQLLSVYLGNPAETADPVLLNGAGTRVIHLTQPPAADPDAPVIERETQAGVWEVVLDADYQIIGNEIRHDSGWHFGTGNYRITYTRGYADDSTDPFFLRARVAVLDLIKMMWVGRDTAGYHSQTIGEYSYTMPSGDGGNMVPESLKRLRGLVYS